MSKVFASRSAATRSVAVQSFAIMAALGLLAGPARAEIPPRATAPAAKVAPAQVVSGRMTPAVRRKPLPVVAFTPATADFKLIQFASMDGWTAISNAATRGGASLYTFKGATTVVTTGSDNTLYAAPFDPASPGMIASPNWENIEGVTFYSEPHCQADQRAKDKPGDYELICLGLGQAGNAVAAMFSHYDGDFGFLIGPEDLGGQGAPSAPVFLTPPSFGVGLPKPGAPYFVELFDFAAGVWGGSNGEVFTDPVKAGLYTSQASNLETWHIDNPRTWMVLKSTYSGVPGCAVTFSTAMPTLCAAPTADGKVRLFAPGSNANLVEAQFLAGDSPALPAGLSGETAVAQTKTGRYVVLARGKDGKLYQIDYTMSTKAFSAWKPEGGYMIAHTQPSCVTVNETAICVVQGSDGRLYARQLNSAGAL